MLEVLTLPSLTDFHVEVNSRPSHKAILWPGDDFQAFQTRSGFQLDTLSMKGIFISESSLRSLLRTQSSLTTFRFHHPGPHPNAAEYIDQEIFEVLRSHEYPDGAAKELLLPNLQELSVQGTCGLPPVVALVAINRRWIPQPGLGLLSKVDLGFENSPPVSTPVLETISRLRESGPDIRVSVLNPTKPVLSSDEAGNDGHPD
jgi:hypothetical protein